MLFELTNIEPKLQNMKLEDFIFIKEIGYGQFGEVYLLEDREKNKYAIKCIPKTKVEDLNLESHLQVPDYSSIMAQE